MKDIHRYIVMHLESKRFYCTFRSNESRRDALRKINIGDFSFPLTAATIAALYKASGDKLARARVCTSLVHVSRVIKKKRKKKKRKYVTSSTCDCTYDP